ncbi:MAG: S1 RNA-binding domain-containing protein [Candidatus Saganbacteria bacterium]|nr:S1 RNA-binding domain-containing protein [Candidatus Saganbacteria bacterium]
MAIAVGEIVEGKVTGIANFGAFVDLGEGKVGLVHISQVNHGYVTDISQHLKVGQAVKVKIVSINKDGKFDLSIKQAMDPPMQQMRRPARDRRQKDRPAPGSFDEKMMMFLKDSEEKQLDLKKNLQYKQEGKKRTKVPKQ